MVSAASSINFAAIGHQDSWLKIERFVNGMRAAGQEKLSVEKIRNIFPFVPPRVVFKMKAKSATGAEINGVYIDAFIDPDKLDVQYTKANIRKVLQAVSCAEKEGAAIATLGGFTSIVLEGNFDSFPTNGTKFTTGNTLTSAYIVKGVEAAVDECGLCLKDLKLLIVGATGDIGTACVGYFKTRVKQLLLSARNSNRLEKLAQQLRNEGVKVKCQVSVDELLPEADVVICVASATGLKFTRCKKGVLICDAGYPKNLDQEINDNPDVRLFHGGMGQIVMGYSFHPDYTNSMYDYPTPGIGHGCILEAVVLAFENRIENYSTGKGNISPDKIEEIYASALKHGVTLAPFHNSNGLWQTQKL